jgi:hypothetical protein
MCSGRGLIFCCRDKAVEKQRLVELDAGVIVCFKERLRKAAVRDDDMPLLDGSPAIVLGQDAECSRIDHMGGWTRNNWIPPQVGSSNRCDD